MSCFLMELEDQFSDYAPLELGEKKLSVGSKYSLGAITIHLFLLERNHEMTKYYFFSPDNPVDYEGVVEIDGADTNLKRRGAAIIAIEEINKKMGIDPT